ncbi:MAG TPA: protein kinase [Thermoanaerobaculia bacterium]|nr:protein kinase [Thermoanaerobaculia bacterium]
MAIAEGLIRWEDLDAVAENLPADGGKEAVSPRHGRWVAALVGAGLLTEDDVARLDAELRSERVDLTPDLAGPARSWPAPPSASERAAEASAPPPSPFPPELSFLSRWPRYRVDRLLGSGGMGTVFKAFDPTLGRWVALKFLHRNDERQTERFLREARSQARVSHPNVCQVHEVGEAEGRPYIAMQFIDGRSLGELCDELARDEQVRLVRDVARAVHAAHRTGLVHRDLKPGNILLTRDDDGEIHPYVVDFGLAMTQDEVSLSRTGMISGTPAYISPEAAQGHPLDRRTDVYSLGVVLYELLAGTPPFVGANLARVLVQLVQEDPKPLRLMAPATPEDLETIVAKCLEKDPGRRYASARELAEDLDRFLDGEPIRARPTGWTYRAGKRLRKNKALAIVSAAAVLGLLLIGLWSLRAQWQARERAELAQRFGQRIGSFRTSMEYVATQPLHDITPYKRQLRAEMDAIRAEMKRIGPVAEGPGNFALGQGYLALHQDDAAREHLRRAWGADERGPEVAEALGLAFGRAYERALADADRSPAAEGPSLREEAESLYRRPAVSYLRAALASAPGASHLTGLIALYEGRYAEALADARRDAASPQAARLEAKVFAAQATEAARAGRYAEAVHLFDRSGETYAALAASRPSDPDLYADDCARRARRLQAAIALADVPEAVVKADLAACGRALRVDPGLAEGLVVESDLLSRLGEQKLKRGTDPTGDLSAGIRLAASAIALDPRDVEARNHLAMSHRLLAQWQMGHGGDARADIQQGIAAAKGAVAIQPDAPSGYDHLGTAYIVLAQDQQRRGADPRQAVAQAVASYQKAADLNPQSLPAFIGLGNAWKVMSEVEVAQGLDPSLSTGKGVAALERAAALNPSWATIHNNLGNAHLTLGESLLTRGLDPRAALDRAAMSYRRAIELKPDYYLARFNLAYTWRSLGEALLDQGQDPKPALDPAGAALDEATRLNATDADVFLERARVKLLAARWRQRQRQDVAPELAAAAAELARAEALNPQQPDVFFAEGQVARYRAETARDDAARAVALRDGLERVGKALAINAGEARYLALRGLIESLAARLERNPARRGSQARQAVASLEAAFKINPFLQREYGPALAEARLDAGLASPRPAQL